MGTAQYHLLVALHVNLENVNALSGEHMVQCDDFDRRCISLFTGNEARFGRPISQEAGRPGPVRHRVPMQFNPPFESVQPDVVLKLREVANVWLKRDDAAQTTMASSCRDSIQSNVRININK